MAGKISSKGSKEILTHIDSEVDGVRSDLKYMRNDLMKIVYALIGVIAATVGSGFVHSPIHVIITNYIALFSGVFVVASTAHKWNTLSVGKRSVRLAFSSFILFSAIAREILVIESTPEWYCIVVNMFLILISVILTINVWRDRSDDR